jgi:hypothetical protein
MLFFIYPDGAPSPSPPPFTALLIKNIYLREFFIHKAASMKRSSKEQHEKLFSSGWKKDLKKKD